MPVGMAGVVSLERLRAFPDAYVFFAAQASQESKLAVAQIATPEPAPVPTEAARAPVGTIPTLINSDTSRQSNTQGFTVVSRTRNHTDHPEKTNAPKKPAVEATTPNRFEVLAMDTGRGEAGPGLVKNTARDPAVREERLLLKKRAQRRRVFISSLLQPTTTAV